MSRARIFLIIIFILTFITAASTIVLYTNGWRFDVNEKRLVQTGTVFLNMNVREAKIFVNNELQKTTSPLSSNVLINNVLPGINKIRVEKNGYLPWEKETRIRPQQTARFLNVLLLPKEIKKEYILPIEQIKNIIDFSASPNGNIIAIKEKDENVKLWDKKKKTFIDTKLNSLPLTWSSDSNIVVSKAASQIKDLLITLNPSEKTKALTINIPLLNDVKISIDNNKFLLGTLNKNIDNTSTLVSIELNEENAKIPKTKELVRKIKAFALNQNDIYFIDQKYILWKIKADGSGLRQISQNSLALDTNQAIELTVSNSGKNFAIRKIDEGAIWIFNPQTKAFDLVTQNIESLDFSPDDEKLLLVSFNEMYIYFIEETFTPKRQVKTLELLTRLSGHIQKTWWHPQNEHVFFEYDDSVQIIELDNGIKRNGGTIIDNYLKIQESKNNREFIILINEDLFSISVPKIEGLFAF